MKVRSPVGEFPFTLERLRREGKTLVLEGRLGAWPSTVRIEVRDVWDVARLLARTVGRR